MSAESLVVNPTLHPDNDELRLAPRWGGLIRQGSRQRLGVPGGGRVGLPGEGAGVRVGGSGGGAGGPREQAAVLWGGRGVWVAAVLGEVGCSACVLPPPIGAG